jgi:hypothetical protein
MRSKNKGGKHTTKTENYIRNHRSKDQVGAHPSGITKPGKFQKHRGKKSRKTGRM